jgi:hypothetical protein
MNERKQYRQGDVYLIEVSEIPAEAKETQREEVILAYGEATGHSHKIVHPGAAMRAVDENLRFIRLEEAAELQHEEHAVIKLPAGNFQVITQRQYTPQRWVNVAD